MCIPFPEVQWSAFTEALFVGPPDVQGCSGGL